MVWAELNRTGVAVAGLFTGRSDRLPVLAGRFSKARIAGAPKDRA